MDPADVLGSLDIGAFISPTERVAVWMASGAALERCVNFPYFLRKVQLANPDIDRFLVVTSDTTNSLDRRLTQGRVRFDKVVRPVSISDSVLTMAVVDNGHQSAVHYVTVTDAVRAPDSVVQALISAFMRR